MTAVNEHFNDDVFTVIFIKMQQFEMSKDNGHLILF